MLTYRGLDICSALNVVSFSTLYHKYTICLCATKTEISSPVKIATVSYFYFWSIGPFYGGTDAGWVGDTLKKTSLRGISCILPNNGSQVSCKIAFFGQRDVGGD